MYTLLTTEVQPALTDTERRHLGNKLRNLAIAAEHHWPVSQLDVKTALYEGISRRVSSGAHSLRQGRLHLWSTNGYELRELLGGLPHSLRYLCETFNTTLLDWDFDLLYRILASTITGVEAALRFYHCMSMTTY